MVFQKKFDLIFNLFILLIITYRLYVRIHKPQSMKRKNSAISINRDISALYSAETDTSKPSSTTLHDEKHHIKKVRNRLHARNSRIKKKNLILSLKTKNEILNQENIMLKDLLHSISINILPKIRIQDFNIQNSLLNDDIDYLLDFEIKF